MQTALAGDYRNSRGPRTCMSQLISPGMLIHKVLTLLPVPHLPPTPTPTPQISLIEKHRHSSVALQKKKKKKKGSKRGKTRGGKLSSFVWRAWVPGGQLDSIPLAPRADERRRLVSRDSWALWTSRTFHGVSVNLRQFHLPARIDLNRTKGEKRRRRRKTKQKTKAASYNLYN